MTHSAPVSHSESDIHVGVLIAYSPAADRETLQAFALRAVEDAREELEDASGSHWHFHLEEPTRLETDDPRRPSDFLDEASLRMAEGPYDAVLVVTDVALVSRRCRVVAGLVSPVSHVAVVSARKLLVTPRGQPLRTLASAAVRWNAGALLLHLFGHMLGLPHLDGDPVMSPFRFDESRTGLPRFGRGVREKVRRLAARIPERELVDGNFLQDLVFHASSAFLHPAQALLPILRSRAPLLPLALPSLATAAVVPTFILVFTAEIWDVGLNMSNAVAWGFGLASILAATWYLTAVQNLFFPRKEKRVITEHLAIVNVSILVTMFFAMLGLFVGVSLLMLAIVFYVFPAGLMRTWPTLEAPEIDFAARFRLAAFISTIGVITGALGGGLESRTVLRHLALFLDEP